MEDTLEEIYCKTCGEEIAPDTGDSCKYCMDENEENDKEKEY